MKTPEWTKPMNLEELQQNTNSQDVELQQQLEQFEAMIRNLLTKEAFERYSNLKIAHPEKSVQLLVILAKAIHSGEINQKVDDAQLKNLLVRLTPPKKEFKIKK